MSSSILRRENPQLPNVLVCAVATHETPGLQLLEASCERLGIGLTLFGMGGEYLDHRFKVRAVHAGLDAIGGDYEVMVMVDAFDCLFIDGLESVLQQWQRFGAPIVFAAERHCHPPEGPAVEEYPEAPTDYRFLNAGGVVARVDEFRRALDTWNVEEQWTYPDDQGFWARLYVDGLVDIALDHHCRIFQCQWIAEQDLQLRRQGFPLIRRDRKPTIRNRHTRTRPQIFHANGFCDIRPFAEHILGAGLVDEILGSASSESD